MGHTNAYQAKSSANDSILGIALCQAFMGFAYGPEVDMAWEATEVASAIYTDRHSSTVEPAARTNGTIELGVKNSLSPVFGQQTRPAPDTIDLGTLAPLWMMEPAPRRARRYGLGA